MGSLLSPVSKIFTGFKGLLLSLVSEKIFIGLPAMAGVWLGITTYVATRSSDYWWFLPAAPVAVGVALAWVGRMLLTGCPWWGRWLIEATPLAAMGVVAYVSGGLLALTQHFPVGLFSLFGEMNESIDKDKLVTAAITAVTTYAALVWTKDIGDGSGAFWASTQFREGMKSAGKHLKVPAVCKRAYAACFLDVVFPSSDAAADNFEGWGLKERGARAEILATYLKSIKPTSDAASGKPGA